MRKSTSTVQLYSNARVIFFSIAFTDFVNVGAAHTSNHPLSSGRRAEKYIFRRIVSWMSPVVWIMCCVSRFPWQIRRRKNGKGEIRERGGGEANSYPSPTIEGGVGWLGEKWNGGGFQEGGRRKSVPAKNQYPLCAGRQTLRFREKSYWQKRCF